MNDPDITRRSVLRGLALSLGIAGIQWPELARAAHEAHAAAQAPATATYKLLSAEDAADVEALTNQIIPGDDTPGAREAGVSFFIDTVLGSILAHWRPAFETGLRDFQQACRTRNPDAASFAALAPARQIEFLHTVETTRFFDQARLLTLCGMLSMPKYGGNRDGAGWKMMGFEDQHVFESPFGYYDRDYPGFGK
jgi:gluconate 2-dehydrogenase subunit 3-like protein